MQSFDIDFTSTFPDPDPSHQILSHTVSDGLLSISVRRFDVPILVHELRNIIRQYSSHDRPSSEQFSVIHRVSRMAWEVESKFELSNLDREDLDILYVLPHIWQFQWLYDIINLTIARIIRTNNDPTSADRYSKIVSVVMNT